MYVESESANVAAAVSDLHAQASFAALIYVYSDVAVVVSGGTGAPAVVAGIDPVAGGVASVNSPPVLLACSDAYANVCTGGGLAYLYAIGSAVC